MTCGIMLSLNCSFIFVMTVFGRRMGEPYRFVMKPFESYFKVFVEGNMEILLQILVNIAMYIPLGSLLTCCLNLFKKFRYIILATVASSVLIELVQFVFRIGLFEVDDIINNTIGTVIGIGIYAILHKLKNVSFWVTDNNPPPYLIKLKKS